MPSPTWGRGQAEVASGEEGATAGVSRHGISGHGTLRELCLSGEENEAGKCPASSVKMWRTSEVARDADQREAGADTASLSAASSRGIGQDRHLGGGARVEDHVDVLSPGISLSSSRSSRSGRSHTVDGQFNGAIDLGGHDIPCC